MKPYSQDLLHWAFTLDNWQLTVIGLSFTKDHTYRKSLSEGGIRTRMVSGTDGIASNLQSSLLNMKMVLRITWVGSKRKVATVSAKYDTT